MAVRCFGGWPPAGAYGRTPPDAFGSLPKAFGRCAGGFGISDWAHGRCACAFVRSDWAHGKCACAFVRCGYRLVMPPGGLGGGAGASGKIAKGDGNC